MGFRILVLAISEDRRNSEYGIFEESGNPVFRVSGRNLGSGNQEPKKASLCNPRGKWIPVFRAPETKRYSGKPGNPNLDFRAVRNPDFCYPKESAIGELKKNKNPGFSAVRGIPHFVFLDGNPVPEQTKMR